MKIPLQDLMRNFPNSLFFIVIASVIAVMQNLLYIKKKLIHRRQNWKRKI